MKTYEFQLLLQFDEEFEELTPEQPEPDIYDLMDNIHAALINQAEGAGLAVRGYTVGAELKATTGEYTFMIIDFEKFQVILGNKDCETDKGQECN